MACHAVDAVDAVDAGGTNHDGEENLTGIRPSGPGSRNGRKPSIGLVVHQCCTHGVTQLRWLAGSNETPPFRKHPSALDSFDSFDLVDPVGPVDPLDRLWQRSRSWHLFDLTAACSLGRGQLQKMNPRNRPRR